MNLQRSKVRENGGWSITPHRSAGFTGTLRPLRIEGDIRDLELEDEVPPQLNGSLHRVQPAARFPPKFENEPFFNDDGMVSLRRLRNALIDCKKRYLQTGQQKTCVAVPQSIIQESCFSPRNKTAPQG